MAGNGRAIARLLGCQSLPSSTLTFSKLAVRIIAEREWPPPRWPIGVTKTNNTARSMARAATITTAPGAFADTYCGQASSGARVYAGNSDTSCEFAISTAEAYWNYGNGSHPFSVHSPVTGQDYTMTCTNAGSVCQGGNNAVVYLRS